MVDGVAEMHPDFPRWYGEVSMDGAACANRWNGIEEIASNLDRAYVEVLVRLAFATKAAAAGNKEPELTEKLSEFHKAFSGQDENYDANAGREVQLLAAATLIYAFSFNPLAPLAVVTASAAGARKINLPMDIVGLAENAVRTLGVERRERPDLKILSNDSIELSYSVDSSALNPNSPPTIVAAIDGLRDATGEVVGTLGTQINASIRKMASYLKVADEELQMLWWLVGEWSIDLGVPFNKVPPAAQPLVFGRELADRTADMPGPAAIRAILSKAGLKLSGKAEIPAAIAAMAETWLVGADNGIEASPITSPIHFAIERRLETGPNDAWVPAWAAITELPANHGAAPALLAELFYRERVYLRLAR